jgi:hypothetical protein
LDTNKDFQAQSILTGLLGLEEILARPLANKALDLSQNATTSAQREMLARLRKSLVQYAERLGDLVYIGFIGHFSSGKSSTINSLLQLWNSKSQRAVDLNPTDKVITLITHDDNANSLHGVLSQGSVPTRVQTVENEFLKQIVLVDTPGTGDPHLLEEMARDFLPVCDVVLFFLSAASPLDATDIPLLSELHRRLPFIPKMFVITRADELRSNFDNPVSHENFDLAKAGVFIGDLKSRISLLLGPGTEGETEFVLIDNKAEFQIEKLKNILARRVDPTNVAVRLNLHSHKIRFFQSTAEKLRDYFSTFLDAKQNELNTIVSAAEANIRRYQQVVMISNNNLTKSWFDNHTSILELLDKASKRLVAFSDLPQSFLTGKTVSDAREKMRSDNKQVASAIAEQIRNHVTQTGFTQIQREFSQSVKNLGSVDLDGLLPEDHGISPITVQWTFGEFPIIPSTYLTAKADVFRKVGRDFVLNAALDIQQSLQAIQKLTQQGYFVDKCVDIVNQAQESLDRDVDLYFQNVRVYRAGVFSMSTKDSIGKLGIGAELDEIESAFTETDKEAIQMAARQDLFPESAQKVAILTTQLSAVSEQIRHLLQEVNQFEIEPPGSLYSQIEYIRTERVPVFLDQLKAELQRDANELTSDIQSRVSGAIGEILKEYEQDVSALGRERRRHYLVVALVTGFLSVVAFFGYRWLSQPMGQSKFDITLWAVAANLMGDAVGLAIARFRDHFPTTKRQIRASFSAILRERVRSVIDQAVKDTKFESLDNTRLGKRLEDLYLEITEAPKDSWRQQLEQHYAIVRAWTVAAQQIRGEYLAALSTFAKDCAMYFEDAEKNLNRLKVASQGFREKAIEPSFELLERTREQLRALKEEIAAIRFS